MQNGMGIIPAPRGPAGGNIDKSISSTINAKGSQPTLRDRSLDFQENQRRSQEDFLTRKKSLNFQQCDNTSEYLRSKHSSKLQEVKDRGFASKDDHHVLQMIEKHNGNI